MGAMAEPPRSQAEGRAAARSRFHSGSEHGLYLHVPFCSAICPYCDFAVTVGDRDRRRRFVAALEEEIRRRGSGLWVDTLALGGGTPSLLEVSELARILGAVRSQVGLAGISEDAEVSLEANPEDVTLEALGSWAELGVTRLSLGVQSFSDAELRFLGRRHTGLEARNAVAAAVAAGSFSVSIDLIYGLPGQSAKAWTKSLNFAADLAVDHVSCYQLTIEPGTPFFVRRSRGKLEEPLDSSLTELFVTTHRHLAELGFEAYEVSNFARTPGHRSRHNAKYWDRKPYLGLGPSAHSFDGTERSWNERDEAAWRRRVVSGEESGVGREVLDESQIALERLMLGLRRPAGVALAAIDLDGSFESRNRERFDRYAEAGWLRLTSERSGRQGRLVPTLQGLARADALARELEILPETEPEIGSEIGTKSR